MVSTIITNATNDDFTQRRDFMQQCDLLDGVIFSGKDSMILQEAKLNDIGQTSGEIVLSLRNDSLRKSPRIPKCQSICKRRPLAEFTTHSHA